MNPYINFVFTIEKINQSNAIKTYEKYLNRRKSEYNEAKKLQDEIKNQSEYNSNHEVLSDVILGIDTLIKCEIDIIISSEETKYKKIHRDIKNILKLNLLKLSSI